MKPSLSIDSHDDFQDVRFVLALGCFSTVGLGCAATTEHDEARPGPVSCICAHWVKHTAVSTTGATVGTTSGAVLR